MLFRIKIHYINTLQEVLYGLLSECNPPQLILREVKMNRNFVAHDC